MSGLSPSPATSTIPNTPRSDNLAKRSSHFGDLKLGFSGQGSTDTNSSRCADILPTWPANIDRTKIPARASWLNQSMSEIFLDIHWAGRHSSAFFKLHTGLHLEGAPGSSRQGLIDAYIFIYPERIRQLTFTAEPQSKPFGRSTVAFTFELNRPPALVLPQTYTGFGAGAEDTICSLRSLVQQSCFIVHASLPSRRLSPSWLEQFCKDFTTHKFQTITPLANLQTLYRGFGGELTKGDSLPDPLTTQDAIAAGELPLYDETDSNLSLTPPSTSSVIGQTVQSMVNVDMLVFIGNMLEAKFAAHERKVGQLLSAHEQMVKEMLSINRRDVEDLIGSVEERVRNDLFDDLASSIKEIVDGEMDGVHDSVMEQITMMPVQAHFSFPNHPYL